MATDAERQEEYQGALERAGLPLPPGDDLLCVRYNMGSTSWYAQTEQGWFWFDDRVSNRGWKFLPLGPTT